MPIAGRVSGLVERRVPSWPLVITRIALGLCGLATAFEAWRLLPRILGPLVVPLPYVPWVPRLTPDVWPFVLGAWCLAAVAFAAGVAARAAGAALAATAAYVLHMDQRLYSNHLYLFVLLVVLVTIADPGAVFSLDARRSGRRPTVAAWPILLLKTQVSVVYGFSALAKLTPDFLSGAVLANVLQTNVIPAAWRGSALMSALAWATIFTESFVAVGLWLPRLRWWALAAGLGLHLAILMTVNSGRLSLAVFAFELVATYPVFFASRVRQEA